MCIHHFSFSICTTYLIGAIVIVIGFLFIWKSEWVYRNFGTVAWAEEHLAASGGTRFFWKLFGLVLILLAFLFMGGVVSDVLNFLFVR